MGCLNIDHYSYWLALICVSFFVSCSSSPSNEEPTELFSESIDLESEVLEIPKDTLNLPLQIITADSFLVVLDRFNKDGYEFYFMQINHFEEEIVSLFGREGRGPDEFLFPSMLNNLPGEKREISIYNARLFTFNEISLDSVLANRNLTISRYSELSTQYAKVIKLDNQTLLGTGFFEGGRYALSDTTGEILYTGGAYPFEDETNNISYRALGMAYQARLVKHPEKKLVVSATINSANMEILKFNEDSLWVVKTINSYPTLFEDESSSNRLDISESNENRYGYQNVAVSEDYIMGLYSGKTMDESFHYTDKVLVFNWQGEPVQQLNLDKEVRYITFDPVTNMIYGLHQNDNGEFVILRFPFKI